MADKMIALVTGVSSGFGRVIAQRLHQRGYKVFGTSRRQDVVADRGIAMLPLDVRSQDSVLACVRTVLEVEGRLVGRDARWVPILKALLPQRRLRWE